MYKKIILLIIFAFLISSVFSQAHAQMMMDGTPSVTINPTDIPQQQLDEAQGKQFFEQLQSNQTTCQKLNSSNFEKIGEYVMSQRFNSTDLHMQMNNNIKQMMGNTGEENMHIKLGTIATGCNTREKGGGMSMMGGYYSGMMGNTGMGIGFYIFCFIGYIIVIVDLILLGMWLWKQIKKK